MSRRLMIRFLLGATVLVAAMSFSPQRSEAGWRHWGHYGYYRPYVRVVRPVYWAGWRTRWWHHRAFYRTAWYPRWNVGYAYNCCNPCWTPCCDPCGVTVSDCCTSTTYSSQPSIETETPTPAQPELGPDAPPPIETEPSFEPSFDPTSGRAVGQGLLSVAVPEEAKVYINGQLTRTPGALRRYVSPGLARGQSYTYEVRAEFVRDGQPVSETRTVRLQAGRTADLAFQLPAEPTVETMLTLNLPENASVTLDGRTMKATGPVRKFATKKLGRGEEWADYQVVVSVERDGRTLTRKENVTLVGGEPRELTFGFIDERLALR